MTPTIARQMFAAEVLKLRRNPGLMAFAFFLSVVSVGLFFGYNAVQHAASPSQHGPAGGVDSFQRAVKFLGLLFGTLTSILIGAEAGTADLSSGVFRDLVATGRSRTALFFARIPAALAVTLGFTAAGFAVALVSAFVFSGSLATPTMTEILQSAGWLVLANAILVTLAVGVGSLTGSRALTLTAVIGWQAVATQLLLNASSLGSARDALLTGALGHLFPYGNLSGLTMATGVAAAVLAVWLVVPALVGTWRTQTQDA